MCPSNNRDEVPQRNGAIVIGFTFLPELICDFSVEVTDGCIVLADLIESLFEFVLSEVGTLVVAESVELGEDFVVVCLLTHFWSSIFKL